LKTERQPGDIKTETESVISPLTNVTTLAIFKMKLKQYLVELE